MTKGRIRTMSTWPFFYYQLPLTAEPVSPERRNCPACIGRRVHTEEEWRNHPYRGHGMTRETGWSHPELAAEAQRAKQEAPPK
jgi:hypothetical protein